MGNIGIKVLENYMTSENTYIVINGGEAFAVDPSYDVEGILRAAGSAKITHILQTHCHYDHIETLEQLRSLTGAKLVSTPRCSENLGNTVVNLTESVYGTGEKCSPADIMPEDGAEFEAAGVNVKIIYTPGHTDGGACYLADGNLFSGDTLFKRSIGRSDLPTGDIGTLEKSVREKLYTLDDEIEVYPGHGGKTSIGYEKKFNMFVRA